MRGTVVVLHKERRVKKKRAQKDRDDDKDGRAEAKGVVGGSMVIDRSFIAAIMASAKKNGT